MTTLLPLSDQVWLFPRDETSLIGQPNVGIITAGDQTVLVDGGSSPRAARSILNGLNAIGAPPVSFIIYTHNHWDHVFGAMVFRAPAIAHELCRKLLVETAARPWSHAYIQEEIQRTPARETGLRALSRAIDDWRGFRVVLPEITLNTTLALYLDDLRVEIEHVGGQHAPDSVVVRVPQAGVLFAADCFYPPPPHQRRPNDRLDADMIRALLRDDIHTYVDGHGPPRTRAAFAALVDET